MGPATALPHAAGQYGSPEEYPEDQLVADLVGARALAAPTAPALVDGHGRLTYDVLDARSRRVAQRLTALGVGPDTLVGLVLERSGALAVGALGILRAGGAYVAFDPDDPTDRLSMLLHDARPPVVVTARGLAGRLPAGPWRVLTVEEAVASPGDGPLASAAATTANLAYVIFTSGSTGRPKGVEITHGSLLNLVFWHRRAFAVTPDDRTTQLASPAFDAAVWELWPSLTAGASVHVPDDATRSTPERLRDWLVGRGITISFVPTPLAERLMALAWPPATALRVLLTGGDTLHSHPTPGLPFTVVNNYGPTESTVVATSAAVAPRAARDGLPPIGRPIANTRIYLLDEGCRPVPPGQPGEVCIGGRGLARGYLNRPELTAERFIPDPFSTRPGDRLYRTGDLARVRPDGQLAFLGRLDHQMKVRGFRIEPEEIVAVLDEHPDVTASAVSAEPDGAGDRRLVAYVVPAAEPPRPSALRAHLAARLPQYMVPTVFVRLTALPLTPSGKIDRAALPPPEPGTTLRDDGLQLPRTPTEARLAALVGELLGVADVGADDNFFLLGGHSLLGTQLIARVRESFAVDLPLRAVFDHPTIATLAAEIERAGGAAVAAGADRNGCPVGGAGQ